MDRIKISEFISTISFICCLAIALGIFLPFVRIDVWGYELVNISIFQFLTDGDINELIEEAGYSGDLIFYIVIFLAAFIAVMISSGVFKISISLVPAVVMIVATYIGKYMVDELTYSVFKYGVAKELIGSALLKWGYKILLLDSIAAFVVNFYLNYISGKVTQLASTVKNNGTNGNNTVKCPFCGTENLAGDRFCSGCGGSLKAEDITVTQRCWFCTQCGSENSANSRFCEKCGASRK